MANTQCLPIFPGYWSKTYTFKKTTDIEISLDVLAPRERSEDPAVVLIHYHGGFLVVGDRYTFLPYWLVQACVTRGWIFVTPDYRLLPESTAHDSTQDAADAFQWIHTNLSEIIGRKIGPVLIGGSSAGAYLALWTAKRYRHHTRALLLIYGMLDITLDRYLTEGSNIFGRPVIDTKPILEEFPLAKGTRRPALAAYRLSGDPQTDPRMGFIAAVHIKALLVDYITGVERLGQMIKTDGIESIPEKDRDLFPLLFTPLEAMPTTILLHGLNDSAVPVQNTHSAYNKLQTAGCKVHMETPEDAEHGFDVRIGNIDVETQFAPEGTAIRSLQTILKLLDKTVNDL